MTGAVQSRVTVPSSRPAAALGESGELPRRLLCAATLILLTGAAFWIRVHGLWGWDGTLSVDEARLALAARGVNESGLPILPSGWLYTRGILVSYLTAPSIWLLGESDFAARLPAVLAGTALIPIGYLLGREAAGRAGGLFVAALVAGHPSLVVWSRQAWFYALYVLLFALALLFLLRALRTHRARDELLAAASIGCCAFTHEVGLFLLAPLAVTMGLELRAAGRDRANWIAPVLSLAIAAGAALLLWLLVTRLRADSLVGAYGEIDEYLSPSIEWPRIRFYLRMLLDGPGLMLAAALVALPLAIRQRRVSTLVLWLALLPTFLHAAFLIPRGPQERYGLTLIVVIAVLAAQGVRLIGQWAVPLLGRAHPRFTPGTAAALALGVMLLAHQDVARAVERAALSAREGSWLRQVRNLGIGPDDLVMTDIPTTVGWYVGGLDYWLVSRDYAKYATRQGDVLRDVHTGAQIVRSRGELERLLRGPLSEKARVWVIASGRSYQWGELVDDELKGALDRAAAQRVNPGDNFRISRLRTASAP